jgi:dihydrofolate reductase
MAKLIYSSIASLDGFVADEDGEFDWAAPDSEVHAVVNELERPIGTYLYGRRMYEVMAGWETASTSADRPAVSRDFAQIWQAAQKVVFSRTLDHVSTARTRLERELVPDAIRELKDRSDSDLSIGGPGLAASAFAAGLVDECHLFVTPIIVGGGTRSLPAGVRAGLELLGTTARSDTRVRSPRDEQPRDRVLRLARRPPLR